MGWQCKRVEGGVVSIFSVFDLIWVYVNVGVVRISSGQEHTGQEATGEETPEGVHHQVNPPGQPPRAEVALSAWIGHRVDNFDVWPVATHSTAPGNMPNIANWAPG